MGRAFHGRPLSVPDLQHLRLRIAAVRLHDLDALAHGKFVALLRLDAAVFRHAVYHSQIGVALPVGIAVVDLRRLVRPPIEKAGGKFPVGAGRDLLPVPVHMAFVQRLGLQAVVDGLPVGPGHRGHVKGRLHAAFDLEAVDPRFQKLRDMLDHAEILGIENKGAPLIFIDGQVLAGPRLLHHRVFPAAGMGAGPLVGVPAGKVIAQKAAAGIGDAHSAVDKGLDLHILRDLRPDFPDLLQGKLPGRDDPLRPLLLPEPPGEIIRIVGLGADVAFNLRADLFCQHKNARIRDDQRIRPQFLQLLEILPNPRQIPVVGQDIRRHMNPHAMSMGEGDALPHILHGKILRLGPKAVGLSADIDRVRAEGHGGL